MPVPSDPNVDNSTREKFRKMLREGKLDDRELEISVSESKSMPMVEILTTSGMEDMQSNLQDAFSKIFPRKKKSRKMKVPEALEAATKEEMEKLVDMDQVIKEALRRTEQSGIVFLDEIDKIASRNGSSSGHGPEVSREGVQRDLLPIVEGATVSTKHGMIKTDHILFIASGAFHLCKPSDLIPELQGRFPIRVELDDLKAEDLKRILTEPRSSLLKQYTALLAVDGLRLVFSDEAVEAIAAMAHKVNNESENLGARRLHTVLERLLEEVLFDAPDNLESDCFEISAEFVQKRLSGLVEDRDLSRFIL
jgi:ATP-dependent HslUV protease ATP-binding subunit HslU